MTKQHRPLSPSEAARRLGVSTKALKVYERRSLIAPIRSEAGWRCYRQEDLAAAAQIIALRNLGLSLSQIERVLDGDLSSFEVALAEHEQGHKDASTLANGAAEVHHIAEKIRP